MIVILVCQSCKLERNCSLPRNDYRTSLPLNDGCVNLIIVLNTVIIGNPAVCDLGGLREYQLTGVVAAVVIRICAGIRRQTGDNCMNSELSKL